MKTTLASALVTGVFFMAQAAVAQTLPPPPPGISNRIEARVSGLPNQPAAPRSEAELKAEIAAQPKMFRAYSELALLYRSSSRLEEAETVLRAALPHVSNRDAVYSGLANVYSMVYQPEKVLAIADEWQGAAPGMRPLTMIGFAHLELAKRLRGSRTEALEHLDDAARAAADGRVSPGDVGIAIRLQAQILQVKAEFETNPETRAKLLSSADGLMKEAHEASLRYASERAVPPPPRPPPPPPPPSMLPLGLPAPPGAVRVGGNVKPPLKIHDVRPVYPPEAQQARIQGVVIAEIRIEPSGSVGDVRVLRSIPMLDQAAIEAVRQWQFEPTLLNGVAVPVVMTVTVAFNMM